MCTIEMPINIYYVLLRSVPCTEAFLTPHHTVTDADAAEQYALARDYWIANRWADLNFDGGLTMYPELARLLYNITHMESVWKWEKMDGTEWWVKGPVDFLRIREVNGRVLLNLEGSMSLVRYVRQNVIANPEGEVSALRTKDGRSLTRQLSTNEEDLEKLVSMLAECMQLVFEEVSYA